MTSLDPRSSTTYLFSAEGYLSIDGRNVNTMAAAYMRSFSLLAGQVEVRNVPQQIISRIPQAHLFDINAGDTVKFEITDGHVSLNGKPLNWR